MFLAGRLTGISLAFRASSSPISQPLQPPPATSVTADQVLAIKEAGRSRIVEEERKIGDLVGKLSRMDLEGLSRDELMGLEIRVVSLRRELYDVVHSRPLYAPQR